MIYVFGKHGQVATELQRVAERAQRQIHCFSSALANFNDASSIEEALRQIPARSIVINASAYTQVDLAETEVDLAQRVNATTPGKIAQWCHENNCPLIQLSTDYVFSGQQKSPYQEDDPVGPSSVYGKTKLEGEQLVLTSNPQSIILRTSWVFSAHGRNFVKTMLRLSKERSQMRVVADQFGGPTSATAIAQACLKLADQLDDLSADHSAWGIYHFAGTPIVSWAQFAVEIFRQANVNVPVEPIASSDYPTPAKRPSNSALDCSKIKVQFGIDPPDWKRDLQDVLSEIAMHQDSR